MLLDNDVTGASSLFLSLVSPKPLRNPFLCSRGYRLLYRCASGVVGELWYFSFFGVRVWTAPWFSVFSVSYPADSSCLRLRALVLVMLMLLLCLY